LRRNGEPVEKLSLKKDTLIILRNFYQIELSIVKRFSSLVAIGNARNVEGTCSISTWNVLLIFGDEIYSWLVFFLGF